MHPGEVDDLLAVDHRVAVETCPVELIPGEIPDLGIGVIVASLIPGIGFLGFAEIIQLLQDQKTILLRQNRK